MSRGADALPLREAITLGALQGPCELLPVSSSAHLSLIPRLRGWRYAGLDPELRKSFEVAVHAGTAVALAWALRGEAASELAGFDRRRAAVVGLSFLPAAAVGYAFERRIESLSGDDRWLAGGLAAGSLAMVAADRRPQERGQGSAGPVDGLLLGLAQAAALVPGVSRNGATLTAARWRRFTRDQANRLSRTVALPVIAGASVLKGVRLARRGVPAGTRVAIAAGAGTSLISTLASKRLIDVVEQDRSLAPYAVYRLGLAVVAWRSARRSS